MSDWSDYLLQGVSTLFAIWAVYSLVQAPWGRRSENESSEMNDRLKAAVRTSTVLSGLFFLIGVISLAVYGTVGFLVVFSCFLLFMSWACLASIPLTEAEFKRFNFDLRLNRAKNFGSAFGLFVLFLILTKLKDIFLG